MSCRNVAESVGFVDAYLVVYSVTDRSSFTYAQNCLQDLKRHRLLTNGVSLLLVANKQDLVRNRIVSESGESWRGRQ
jgi:GTPase SAR1 family protein